VFREGSKSRQVYYTSAEASKRRIAEYIDMVERGIIENKTLEILRRLNIPIPSWYYTIKLELYPKADVLIYDETKKEEDESNGDSDVEKCPTCGSTRLVRQSGCVTCLDCGWSTCIVS